ncbi:MAG: hypothetical protein K0Q63_1497 [Paenibacillus sp.]|jgi:hypothetical protein|nr:hypothetical protein [Paenibacillus sp.]
MTEFTLHERQREVALRLAPVLMMDRLEPFRPVRVGITVFEAPGHSPSFNRRIEFEPDRIASVIEYAMYWDYDIQHLYELEHAWIYVDHEGKVARCEASSHGSYKLGLLRDGSNLTDDGRVKLFVQPGKHAMSALEEVFRLYPNVESCCMEEAGTGGVLENELFRGQFKYGGDIDKLAEAHLRSFAFRPSFEYVPYEWESEMFVSWEELRDFIPERMKALQASLMP